MFLGNNYGNDNSNGSGNDIDNNSANIHTYITFMMYVQTYECSLLGYYSNTNDNDNDRNDNHLYIYILHICDICTYIYQHIIVLFTDTTCIADSVVLLLA